ncbi:hypothetical protein H1W00_13855 [Aeromicrobium sp. Marseille-Q0843]|uniref:Lipoprotein n=1 Tax=Aeromicrobium phoceense TaxID=2754045 RepID=A0A838XLS6_9ACTN|nr:hypothetical protein [Aeromicrobium phoceense]MBA4609566.1 hypothetical protein [Aeromicrobium phoceense]
MGYRVRAVAVGAAALLLTACGSSEPDSPWRTAAEDFVTAIAAQDADAGCDLLSDAAQTELADTAGSCEDAILSEGLDDPGRIEDVQRFGTAAQVRFEDDVYFLGQFSDGWRITAAGCDETAAEPYDCDVSGG